MGNEQGKSKKQGNLFTWWILNENELQTQVNNYKSLNIWHSARKLSALLLTITSIVTVISIYFSKTNLNSLIDALIVLTLAFFVYRGKSWAMIVAMIYWTINKFYSFMHTGNITIQLLWWAALMAPLYQSLRIELQRKNPEKITWKFVGGIVIAILVYLGCIYVVASDGTPILLLAIPLIAGYGFASLLITKKTTSKILSIIAWLNLVAWIIPSPFLPYPFSQLPIVGFLTIGVALNLALSKSKVRYYILWIIGMLLSLYGGSIPL